MGVGLLAAGAAACGSERETRAAQAQPPARAVNVATASAAAVPPARPPTAVDSAALRVRIAAQHDSVEAAFARARPLGASEVARLRQDVNAEQVATARRLGIPPSTDAEIRRLLASGRLVALADSTEFWVLRDMDHSVPYVTPNARGMLMELGRRFHARLDRLGLPRYRMKVTSALRTDETQARLRKINSYAARTVSAHEFGTTVDVSHERFAVPADPSPLPGAEMRAEMLDDAGKAHATVLQAELGRAIAEMRDQGALHVMMENMQPVYHMTVARPFTR
ncbi:MAG TPA: DUF5715 family protein [Longimicrobiaceae bacterium]|nr:DUF5715 family protein [Longimicrobiaceae bacterium]